MAEKRMFVRFMSAFKKHVKTQYPFLKQLEKSLDASIPKSSSFYLGVSPTYNKHVVIHFLHLSKPWRIGQFTITVLAATDLDSPKLIDIPDEEFESFNDGRFSLPIVLAGRNRYWCLNPTDRSDDNLTTYWKPRSYDSDDVVIQEAIADVCNLLDKLLEKAGFATPNPTRVFASPNSQ